MRVYAIVLALVLFASLASAAPSRTNTDYYYDGTNYVYDDGATALNSGTPANTDPISSYGWSVTGGTSPTYTTSKTQVSGGMLFQLPSSSSGSRTLVASDYNNASYSGNISITAYYDSASITGATFFRVRDSADSALVQFGWYHSTSNYYCSSTCSASVTAVKQDYVNFTASFSGGDLYIYATDSTGESKLLDTITSFNGVGKIEIISHTDSTNTPVTYWGDLRQCTSTSCPQAASGPSVSSNFTISAQTFYFNTTLLDFTAQMDGTNYSTSNGTIYTPYLQNHTTTENVIVFAENHQTRTYTALNLSSNLFAELNYTYHLLNVTLNSTGGGVLENFTITARSTNGGANFTKVANGSTAILNISIGGIYNLTLDAVGNAIDYKTYTDNGSWWQHVHYDVLPENSVYVYIKDEDTQALIASNTSITFNGNSSFIRYSANGTLLERDLEPGEWDLTFLVLDTSLGYGTRTYTITISNRSTQNLDAFLATDVSTTILTIKDKDSGSLIQGASVTMQRLINSSYTNIETKSSDITGRTQFSYSSNILYRFIVTKANYDQLVFTLNPILFSAYTIQLEKEQADTQASLNDRVHVSLAPARYYRGANAFTFLIQSSYGELQAYGYNVTLPNGTSYTGSGVNANGEQLSRTLNITSPSLGERVRVDYTYTTTIEGVQNVTRFFEVVANGSTNTIVSQREDPTFGMGIGERLLILAAILIVLMGISALIGQLLIGGGLMLFIMGFLVFVGFVPLWSVLISILIGLLILASRAGGP